MNKSTMYHCPRHFAVGPILGVLLGSFPDVVSLLVEYLRR
jgi:hypothetical protein